jgi:lipoate-protein ligase A
VGSAQLRVGEVLLQHGSVLLEDDQRWIARLRADGRGDEDRPATLGEALGRPVDASEVVEALAAGFADAVPGDWRAAGGKGSLPFHGLPTEPRPDLLERYRSHEWTWRR